MSWCTSGVGLQVLPFIDNSHLGSNLCFQFFVTTLAILRTNIIFIIKVFTNSQCFVQAHLFLTSEVNLRLVSKLKKSFSKDPRSVIISLKQVINRK